MSKQSNTHKRVLIFSTAYFPLVGGAEVAIKEITNRLPEYEFDLITALFDRSLPYQEKFGRVTIHRLGIGSVLDKFILPVLGFIKAYQLHRRNSYHLVWAIMASQAGITAAFFKYWCPEVPFLLTLQEGDEEEHLKRYVGGVTWLYTLLIRPWYLFVLTSADRLTVISEYLRKRAELIVPGKPIDVIPNGVDIELFAPTKNKFILGYFLVVTTSRLVYKNGVDVLIRAMALLPPSIRLAIIGEGLDRPKLETLIDELKLGERVELYGYLSQSDLIKFLCQADVFARPARSEGLGNSFLEAMATKTPVIATPVGGIIDFIKDSETGWLVEPENPSELAQKISYLLDEKNKSAVTKVIDQAFKLVHNDYTWPPIALRIKTVFDLLTT